MGKYTLGTLPVDDAKAAIELVKDLIEKGEYTGEAAQMIAMKMVSFEQEDLFYEAMRELKPKISSGK